MIILLFFTYHIFKKLYLENDHKVKLILVGATSLILLQSVIHIGVNIRLFPTTGMTLPFISYGGSSLIASGFLMGLLLACTRRRPQGNVNQ